MRIRVKMNIMKAVVGYPTAAFFNSTTIASQHQPSIKRYRRKRDVPLPPTTTHYCQKIVSSNHYSPRFSDHSENLFLFFPQHTY